MLCCLAMSAIVVLPSLSFWRRSSVVRFNAFAAASSTPNFRSIGFVLGPAALVTFVVDALDRPGTPRNAPAAPPATTDPAIINETVNRRPTLPTPLGDLRRTCPHHR